MTCSDPRDLQSTVDNATAGATITVTGPCTGNLNVTTNAITLVAVTAPDLGETEITAVDTTSPVININSQNVTINGFTIKEGTDRHSSFGSGFRKYCQ